MTAVRNIGFLMLATGMIMYAVSTFFMRDTLEPFTAEDAARLEQLNTDPILRGDISAIEESTRLIRKSTPNLAMAKQRATVANWGWLLTVVGAPIFAAGYVVSVFRRPAGDARSQGEGRKPGELSDATVAVILSVIIGSSIVAAIMAAKATF